MIEMKRWWWLTIDGGRAEEHTALRRRRRHRLHFHVIGKGMKNSRINRWSCSILVGVEGKSRLPHFQRHMTVSLRKCNTFHCGSLFVPRKAAPAMGYNEQHLSNGLTWNGSRKSHAPLDNLSLGLGLGLVEMWSQSVLIIDR